MECLLVSADWVWILSLGVVLPLVYVILVKDHAWILIVIALSGLGFKATTQYWFEQDKLLKYDASSPGWTTYEYKVAVQMRKELREVLGYDR